MKAAARASPRVDEPLVHPALRRALYESDQYLQYLRQPAGAVLSLRLVDHPQREV